MISGLKTLYSPQLPTVLVGQLAARNTRASSYLAWFWRTDTFSIKQAPKLSVGWRVARAVIAAGMLCQLVLGGYLFYLGAAQRLTGGMAFGLAVIVAYPVVWAHLLVVPRLVYMLVWSLAHPKQAGKSLLCSLLEHQVKQLRRRQSFTLVAVTGSVGKTSTKLAIATVLGASHEVRYQAGNYNDRLTVPLVLFGREQPALLNGFAWLRILLSNHRAIRRPYPFRYVIVELGTDGPGQIARFAYLQPELAVVTAVAAEHMEYFGTLDAVAAEELAVFDFAKQVVVNSDDIDPGYLKGHKYDDYGQRSKATHRLVSWHSAQLGYSDIRLRLSGQKAFSVTVQMMGRQGAKIALAAAAVAAELGYSKPDIERGLAAIEPFAGRMRVLTGSKQSIILDDSYNASPTAVTAGLDVLYSLDTPQRIAILGNMNELGDHSAAAHRAVGDYCDPKMLDYVVTIGPDAKRYLAAAAKANGCQVKSFMNPYKAGRFVKNQLRRQAAILAEGSQNGVFAEEAVKVLLADSADETKLVRQSAYWLSVKRRQFKN